MGLQKLVLCLGIEMAALMGANLRQEDFEDLLRNAQRTRIESLYREEDRDDNNAD